MSAPADVRLRGIYVVLDAGVSPDLPALLGAVLAGGVRVVQYRAKAGVDRVIAERLARATRESGGLFIVNDDLETALAIPEAGLHVGQEDVIARDPDALRRFGTGRALGVSCGTPAEALEAERLGASYLGVGPFAATSTKRDAGPAIGETGLRAVVAATSLPVAAIGGIDERHLPAVARTGAAMAAVVSAVARATDPRDATARLVAAWPRIA